MAPISGPLNALSKALPSVNVRKSGDDIEDRQSLLRDSDSADHLEGDEGRDKSSRRPADTEHSVRNANSKSGPCERTKAEISAAHPGQTVNRLRPAANPSVSMRPPHSKGHRSSSSSQVETWSPSRKSGTSATEMQRAIEARLSSTKDADTPRSRRNRSEYGFKSPLTEHGYLRTSYKWSSLIRPRSNPDLREASTTLDRPIRQKPLETCLKQKAEGANTTPPHEHMADSRSELKLRRTKTVDLEEAILKYVLPRGEMSSSAVNRPRSQRQEASKRVLSCHGTAALARRSPASPAITRTDVHVITIAPTPPKSADLKTMHPEEIEDADPAIRTMQIGESNNGDHEVIWDDVPTEHSARTRRRSSSASQVLEAVGLTATRGLERVNTKLTEWSDTWKTSSDSFKPTIVVYPDDDDRRPQFKCTIMDGEDIEMFAPPNSERVSPIHSRHHSRPISAQMSRAAFQDGSSTAASAQETSLEEPIYNTDQPLVVPDPDAWSAHLVTARRKPGAFSPKRKLSNIEEADVKFRNLPGFVTVAHSRLTHSEVRPELFAHRDSLLMAKQRMPARNHAAPALRHMHRPKSRSEPGP